MGTAPLQPSDLQHPQYLSSILYMVPFTRRSVVLFLTSHNVHTHLLQVLREAARKPLFSDHVGKM